MKQHLYGNMGLRSVSVTASRQRSGSQPGTILPKRVASFQIRCAIAGLIAAWTGTTHADPISLGLTGDTQVDLWGANSLTLASNPSTPAYPGFPGNGAWPKPILSPIGDDAYLIKISNGPGGGPFPSGSGIYFGGFDTGININGGTLGIVDDTPVTGLKTVAFQIQIGQAYGYDLLNNDLSGVKLIVTTDSGTVLLTNQSYAGLLNRFYNGSVPMPTGPAGEMEPQDIYVNLWGMQWDLSSISSNILSYQIQFTGVQHASLGQLQVNQTNNTYGSASVFPGDFVWNGSGANTNWTTTANWNGGAAPTTGRNVTLNGNAVAIDAPQNIGTLNLKGGHGFTLSSIGGAGLETTTGINVVATSPATHTISAPIQMNAFNLLDVPGGQTLNISGPITGAGFYKQGAGDLNVSGTNTYNGADASLAMNGLIVRGGTNTFSGTNTITGAVNISFNVRQDTIVVLRGGDDRMDAKFALNLMANSSKLVLGDTTAGSDQTFSGITGIGGAQIVNGGSAETSVLTVNTSSSDSDFAGRLGGDGPNENNLSLVKTGPNSLALASGNTYSGGTTINAGAVVIKDDRTLGTGALTINGGTLRYGAAFSDLRAITIGSAGAALDTQGFHVSYGQTIAGSNRFTKAGSKGFLTLTGANTYSGGTTVTSGFLSVDQDSRLGAVPASVTTDHLNLNLGGLHASESFILSSNRGITLGNPTATSATNGIISVGVGKTLSYDGVIANANSANNGLMKTGAGTLVLTGDNSYSGSTGLHQGKLVLDFSQSALPADILHNSTANNLQVFGGDLEVKGKATGSVSQAFGAITTIGAGHSNIKADSNGGGGTTITLNALARTAGATVNFDLPSAGNITTTTPTAINGIVTSAVTNGVAYATINGSDWATLSGSNLAALASYQASTTDTDWLATDNVAPHANVTGIVTRTINSLKLSSGPDLMLDSGQILTLTAGGILVTGSGASEITGGTIRGANGTTVATRELVVFQYNTADAFTIGSVIANSSTNPTAFTKTGAGTLILTGTNTYTGITRITDGILSVASLANGGVASTVGQSGNGSANLVIDGATLRYTGTGHITDRLFTVGYQGATIDASGSGALNFSNGGNLGNSGSYYRTLTLTGTHTGNNNLSGVIADASSGSTAVVKDGPGTWVLTPGTNALGDNTFTGGLRIDEGTLKIGRAGALNSAGVNRVTFGAADGAALAVNGNTALIAGLSATNAGAIVENGSATAGILSIRNSSDETFAGKLRDGAGGGALSVIKAGAAAQTLSGANTYTGNTTVSQGILNLNGVNSGGGTVNVVDEARLNVNGSLVIGGITRINGALGGSGTISFIPDATLGGNGTVEFALTVGAGQLETITPGNSVGEFTTGSEIWAGGGSYLWEISDANAGLGVGWDHLQINGSLSLTADSSTPFTLQLASLTGAGLAGNAVDFAPDANFFWTFATASGGITGFHASDFAIDATGLTNELSLDGHFVVIQDGNSLVLHYAIPEPSSALFLMGSGLWLADSRRRRPTPHRHS